MPTIFQSLLDCLIRLGEDCRHSDPMCFGPDDDHHQIERYNIKTKVFPIGCYYGHARLLGQHLLKNLG